MMLFTNEMKEEMRMRGCKDCTYFIPGVNACVRGFKRCAVTEPRKTIKKGRYWYDLPLSCRYCYFWDPKTMSCTRGGGPSCAYLVSEELYIPKSDDLPKRKKSVCETCPYGRREPCIGVCMKKLLKEWREERKEATVYA